MKIIFLFIIAILLIGGFVFMYYFYESPLQEEEAMTVKINLYTIDGDSHERISANYQIYNNGNLQEIGKTNKNAAIEKTFLVNDTLKIQTNASGYYTGEVILNRLNISNSRVEISMKKRGNVVVGVTGEIGEELKMYLTEQGDFQNPTICFKWSTHLIYVKPIGNYTQVDKFDTYDKCFKFDNGIQFETVLDYKTFGTVDYNDNIMIYLLDFDEISQELTDEPIIYEIKKI
jgi:hypothetical protein